MISTAPTLPHNLLHNLLHAENVPITISVSYSKKTERFRTVSPPPFAALARDVGDAGFVLSVERVEVLVEALFGGLSRIYRAADDRFGHDRAFPNDRHGLRKLIEWLGGFGIARVVFEPTGRYHRGLEDALTAADVPACKVNPRQARRFAEATGKLAKTDRVDARLLARLGVALEPAPVAATGENLLQLRELVLARRALIRDRTAIKNREKGLSLGLLKRQNAQRLHQIETQLAAIDAAITAMIREDEALSKRYEILLSIPGISAVTAATLVVEMPELGTLDARQVASLAGLAPITRQSGTWQGRAFIRGGRAQIRRALYMPALVAARFNPDLKATFDRLTSAGKPPKIAITAVMRKLLILSNALLREERKWRPAAP